MTLPHWGYILLYTQISNYWNGQNPTKPVEHEAKASGKNSYSYYYSFTELHNIPSQISLPMHVILFGSNPCSSQTSVIRSSFHPEPNNFSENVRAKLAQLRKLVDAILAHSANQQQHFYRSNQTCVPLACGQQVLLNNPNAGNLDPHQTGPQTVP